MATVYKIINALAPTVWLVHHNVAFVRLCRVGESLKVGLCTVVVFTAVRIIKRADGHFTLRRVLGR